DPIKGVSHGDALAAVARGQILLGANYAHKTGLGRGDMLTLAGSHARYTARIAGVVQTLNFEDVQMSLRTMKRIFGVSTDAQVAVKAKTPALAPVLERKVNVLIEKRYANLELISAAGKRAEIDREISQQF